MRRCLRCLLRRPPWLTDTTVRRRLPEPPPSRPLNQPLSKMLALKTQNKRKRSQARLTRKRPAMLARMMKMKIWVARPRPPRMRMQLTRMVKRRRPKTVINPGQLIKRVRKMTRLWLRVTTRKTRMMDRLKLLLTKKKARRAYRRMTRIAITRRLPPVRSTKLTMKSQNFCTTKMLRIEPQMRLF